MSASERRTWGASVVLGFRSTAARDRSKFVKKSSRRVGRGEWCGMVGACGGTDGTCVQLRIARMRNWTHVEEAGDVCAVMHGDRAVMAIAARRHGVVTAAELAAAGLGRGAVARRVATGWLQRLHRGVYLVGPVPGPRAREAAAVLACGGTAVLSHRSAAALWGIVPPSQCDVHVTVAGAHPRPEGVRVHRVRRLDPRDVAQHEDVPATAPARTLLDVATLLPPRELARAVEQAEILRLASPTSLAEIVERARGHHGAAPLTKALRRRHEPKLTRSEAERRMLDLIRAAKLPTPRTNVRIHGHEVDLVWPDQRLVVEIDGFTFHSSREAFERDRRRDAQLQAHGYRVMRVTWRQIIDEPHAVIARLAAALQAQFVR
jgi:very-short-patch-repair endonuclease/predicted transcriptional regulator of viral defense system